MSVVRREAGSFAEVTNDVHGNTIALVQGTAGETHVRRACPRGRNRHDRHARPRGRARVCREDCELGRGARRRQARRRARPGRGGAGRRRQERHRGRSSGVDRHAARHRCDRIEGGARADRAGRRARADRGAGRAGRGSPDVEVARQQGRRVRRTRGGAAARGRSAGMEHGARRQRTRGDAAARWCHVSARTVAADAAVVLDVTYAADAPGVDPGEWGNSRLGGGPTIFRGPTIHPAVSAGLRASADAASIAYSLEAGPSTWSDSEALQGEGVPVGLVSIPLRYMHGPNEIVQLSDIDAASRLVEAYVRSLSPDSSFLR